MYYFFNFNMFPCSAYQINNALGLTKCMNQPLAKPGNDGNLKQKTCIHHKKLFSEMKNNFFNPGTPAKKYEFLKKY